MHKSTIAMAICIPLYVFGVFVAEVLAPAHNNNYPQENTFTTLTFVGDMMFDRYIRERASSRGYDAIFSNVSEVLQGSDVIVGNLEGPITTFTSVSDYRDTGPNHYTFTFATSVAKSLQTNGFNAIFLANNHIFNFGKEGYTQTKKWLTENNIGYFGAPDEAYMPLRFASGTINIALFAFDTWYARDVEKLTTAIQKEPNDVFVVVYAHWGDEYEQSPNAGQKKFAYAFIDSGADFVVGSHPHVIQTKERYKEKWIYYSLGNFVFDQYFNNEVTCGAVVKVHVDKHLSYEITESFVTLQRDGTTKTSNCIEFVKEEASLEVL